VASLGGGGATAAAQGDVRKALVLVRLAADAAAAAGRGLGRLHEVGAVQPLREVAPHAAALHGAGAVVRAGRHDVRPGEGGFQPEVLVQRAAAALLLGGGAAAAAPGALRAQSRRALGLRAQHALPGVQNDGGAYRGARLKEEQHAAGRDALPQPAHRARALRVARDLRQYV
jgi:hypothetical protein